MANILDGSASHGVIAFPHLSVNSHGRLFGIGNFTTFTARQNDKIKTHRAIPFISRQLITVLNPAFSSDGSRLIGVGLSSDSYSETICLSGVDMDTQHPYTCLEPTLIIHHTLLLMLNAIVNWKLPRLLQRQRRLYSNRGEFDRTVYPGGWRGT